jgi:hypothetical protein
MTSINTPPPGGAGYIAPPAGNTVGGPGAPGAPAAAKGQGPDALQFINRGGDDAHKRISLDLPGSGKNEMGNVSDTVRTLDGLGATDVAGDIYAVMALFQKMAQEQRNSAREVRNSELTAQVQSLNSAAQEIRNAAQDRFVGAVVAGSMQIAGGLVQAGLAGSSFGKGQVEAGALTGTGTGLGQAMSGIGSIANASMELKAAGHDAKKAELEATAKVHESASQQANDMMQQMMDVIRDVREKLGSIEQSRVETTRGIARNI